MSSLHINEVVELTPQQEAEAETLIERLLGDEDAIADFVRSAVFYRGQRDALLERWSKEPVDPVAAERHQKKEGERITKIVHQVADDLTRDATRWRAMGGADFLCEIESAARRGLASNDPEHSCVAVDSCVAILKQVKAVLGD